MHCVLDVPIVVSVDIYEPMKVQAALVICSLFICDFAYMRLRNGPFPGTYPQIYSYPWSFYMQICYMQAYFWSPYLSHITRSTCTFKKLCRKRMYKWHVAIQPNSKSGKLIIWNVFCSKKVKYVRSGRPHKKGLEVKVDISRWTVVGHCVEIGHAKAQQSSAKHVSQS